MAANLYEARSLIEDEHVKEAARQVEDPKNGVSWLLSATGRSKPRTRYIVVDGKRYPTKAFGFLVAQVASGLNRKTNDMTVDEAAAPLRKLGYREIKPGRELTSDEKSDRELSYHLSLARPQQAAFRQDLLKAFGVKCALSGNEAAAALEAAHVEPFSSGGQDRLENGMLLRADLHKLFDSGDLSFEPDTLEAKFSTSCVGSYAELNGLRLKIPTGGPAPEAFKTRWADFLS